jgi:hypothetical protein
MLARRRLGVGLAIGWLIIVIVAAGLLESRSTSAHADRAADSAPALVTQP